MIETRSMETRQSSRLNPRRRLVVGLATVLVLMLSAHLLSYGNVRLAGCRQALLHPRTGQPLTGFDRSAAAEVMASLQNLTDAKTIGGPVENVALAPAGQRFSLPEIRQAITSWNATAHDAVSAPQHTGHTAQELRHVQAILSDPRVVAVVDESLQKSINGTEDKRTVTAMESALELINTWNRAADGPDPIKIKGKRRISSRVKALVISQIRYGLEGLLQVPSTYTAAGVLPEDKQLQHNKSAFAQQAPWGSPPDDHYGDQYFAMCLTIKDQHKDIREWIGHHKAVGAGKVYLYDTGSKPPLDTVVRDYIGSGFVEHIWSPPDFGNATNRVYPQLMTYQDCMERFGSRHQFLGFIDSDEFLILENGTPSVPALLRHMMTFEPFGALVVNWRVFGSSGHRTKPETGVLQSYSRCLSFINGHTIHIKSIVNTKHWEHVVGPHDWKYQEGFYAVNERFQRVDGPWNHNVTYDKISINHYVLKSFEEYLEKSARGSAMGNHKPLSFFFGINAQATFTCKQALELGPYP